MLLLSKMHLKKYELMKNLIIFLFLFLFLSATIFAHVDLSNYFKDKEACFILYDVTQNKTLINYNSKQCSKQSSPYSTFEIPLSLMAFDQRIINPKTVFKWDGIIRDNPKWNQDQTTQLWIQNSTIWVSQKLINQLGLKKVNYYLKLFNYGNRELNNLVYPELNSHLKISANEQLFFLKKLAMGKLPVSNEAMLVTKANMRIKTLPNGKELFGKIGADLARNGAFNTWFIGYGEKDNHLQIFILNLTDLKKAKSSWPEAKEVVEKILADY